MIVMSLKKERKHMILIIMMPVVMAMIEGNETNRHIFHQDHDKRPECDVVKLAGWHVTLCPIVSKLWPTETENSIIIIITIIIFTASVAGVSIFLCTPQCTLLLFALDFLNSTLQLE